MYIINAINESDDDQIPSIQEVVDLHHHHIFIDEKTTFLCIKKKTTFPFIR